MAKSTQPRMSAEQKKQEREWQVRDAMSTLQRAEQIKRDPSLMKEVKKSASELVKAVGSSRTPAKKKK